jgi:hypothetical protein
MICCDDLSFSLGVSLSAMIPKATTIIKIRQTVAKHNDLHDSARGVIVGI